MDGCLPVSSLCKWKYLYHRVQPVLLQMPARLHRAEMWDWHQRVWHSRTVPARWHLPQPPRLLSVPVPPGLHRPALRQPLRAMCTLALCQWRHLPADRRLHFWVQLPSRWGVPRCPGTGRCTCCTEGGGGWWVWLGRSCRKYPSQQGKGKWKFGVRWVTGEGGVFMGPMWCVNWAGGNLTCQGLWWYVARKLFIVLFGETVRNGRNSCGKGIDKSMEWKGTQEN